jgi:uncharacterized membrane protein YccC
LDHGVKNAIKRWIDYAFRESSAASACLIRSRVFAMLRSLTNRPGPSDVLAIDLKKLTFSLSTFVAAALVLFVSFAVSLPRPWWALLTVYVTAQPMAGAFRPKALYRLSGIAIGAAVSILLVPNLQNSPALLVLCLALWIGFCIYLAVLDRTPRAFLFQMASFSTAIISFPYLYDPSDFFTTTVSRVEEMTVAILCVTVTHMLLRPTNVRPVIRERAVSFLEHASRWTADALGTRHARLEYEHRRKLAADVTELGMLAHNLPFDQRSASATRETVSELQHRLAALLSLASAVADRLDRLRALNAVDTETAMLVESLADSLKGSLDIADTLDMELASRCRALAATHLRNGEWASLLTASLCDRMAAFVDTLHAARALVRAIDEQDPEVSRLLQTPGGVREFSLARDHGLALLAGAATTVAIILYSTFWILLAWPSGSTTAAFAALITCSFAAQDDPAPVIGRYLMSTLATFPLAALYLFVILPRVDGAGMLLVTLAPALLWMGYIQADPARSVRALPMLSCFIVALGFVDRFHLDFALFLNTGLAQLVGVVTTLAVTKLFRSANARWTAYRIVHQNWADLAQLADMSTPLDARTWTAQAIDRLGQIAARMALAGPEDALHAADGLSDLRIGRNIIQAREALADVSEQARLATQSALGEVFELYRARKRQGEAVAATSSLMHALERAIETTKDQESTVCDSMLLALVGMRCNLFPRSRVYGSAA